MKTLISVSLLTIVVLFSFNPALAGDTVGMELSPDMPIIVFADKYVGQSSMVHLWVVPGVQSNLLFRQNMSAGSLLSKLEIGAGPSFAAQKWAYYDVELEFKVRLGKLTWLAYQLGQWSRHDELRDNGLLREQFFYSGFPLGIVGNNQLSDGQKPRFFWGVAYNFGRTSVFGTNKVFVTINLAKTDEMWVAWVIEI